MSTAVTTKVSCAYLSLANGSLSNTNSFIDDSRLRREDDSAPDSISQILISDDSISLESRAVTRPKWESRQRLHQFAYELSSNAAALGASQRTQQQPHLRPNSRYRLTSKGPTTTTTTTTSTQRPFDRYKNSTGVRRLHSVSSATTRFDDDDDDEFGSGANYTSEWYNGLNGWPTTQSYGTVYTLSPIDAAAPTTRKLTWPSDAINEPPSVVQLHDWNRTLFQGENHARQSDGRGRKTAAAAANILLPKPIIVLGTIGDHLATTTTASSMLLANKGVQVQSEPIIVRNDELDRATTSSMSSRTLESNQLEEDDQRDSPSATITATETLQNAIKPKSVYYNDLDESVGPGSGDGSNYNNSNNNDIVINTLARRAQSNATRFADSDYDDGSYISNEDPVHRNGYAIGTTLNPITLGAAEDAGEYTGAVSVTELPVINLGTGKWRDTDLWLAVGSDADDSEVSATTPAVVRHSQTSGVRKKLFGNNDRRSTGASIARVESTNASSAGIKVTIGQGSVPLVLNSRGLITAAKTRRPSVASPSGSLLLASLAAPPKPSGTAIKQQVSHKNSAHLKNATVVDNLFPIDSPATSANVQLQQQQSSLNSSSSSSSAATGKSRHRNRPAATATAISLDPVERPSYGSAVVSRRPSSNGGANNNGHATNSAAHGNRLSSATGAASTALGTGQLGTGTQQRPSQNNSSRATLSDSDNSNHRPRRPPSTSSATVATLGRWPSPHNKHLQSGHLTSTASRHKPHSSIGHNQQVLSKPSDGPAHLADAPQMASNLNLNNGDAEYTTELSPLPAAIDSLSADLAPATMTNHSIKMNAANEHLFVVDLEGGGGNSSGNQSVANDNGISLHGDNDSDSDADRFVRVHIKQSALNHSSMGSSSYNNSLGGLFTHNPPYKQPLAMPSYELQTLIKDHSSNNTNNRTSHIPMRQNNRFQHHDIPLNGSASGGNTAEFDRYLNHNNGRRRPTVSNSSTTSASLDLTTHGPPYESDHTPASAGYSPATVRPSEPANSPYNMHHFSAQMAPNSSNGNKTNNKLRHRLQHLLIGKLIKPQLLSAANESHLSSLAMAAQLHQVAAAAVAAAANYSGSGSPLPVGPQSANASAQATLPAVVTGTQQQLHPPPPLLSAAVANNVANLLASKLTSLVRPTTNSLPSSLHHLFGVRAHQTSTGSSSGTSGSANSRPLRHRYGSLLQATGAHSNAVIHRRTSGMGSLLVSGFVYGLSVLPALMALTGINPLSSSQAADEPSNETTGNTRNSRGAAASHRAANKQQRNKAKRGSKDTSAAATKQRLNLLKQHQPHLPRKSSTPSDVSATATTLLPGTSSSGSSSSYAYLVPLVSAALATGAAGDSDSVPQLESLRVDQVADSPTTSAGVLRSLYAPPPTILEAVADQSDSPDNRHSFGLGAPASALTESHHFRPPTSYVPPIQVHSLPAAANNELVFALHGDAVEHEAGEHLSSNYGRRPNRDLTQQVLLANYERRPPVPAPVDSDKQLNRHNSERKHPVDDSKVISFDDRRAMESSRVSMTYLYGQQHEDQPVAKTNPMAYNNNNLAPLIVPLTPFPVGGGTYTDGNLVQSATSGRLVGDNNLAQMIQAPQIGSRMVMMMSPSSPAQSSAALEMNNGFLGYYGDDNFLKLRQQPSRNRIISQDQSHSLSPPPSPIHSAIRSDAMAQSSSFSDRTTPVKSNTTSQAYHHSRPITTAAATSNLFTPSQKYSGTTTVPPSEQFAILSPFDAVSSVQAALQQNGRQRQVLADPFPSNNNENAMAKEGQRRRRLVGAEQHGASSSNIGKQYIKGAAPVTATTTPTTTLAAATTAQPDNLRRDSDPKVSGKNQQRQVSSSATNGAINNNGNGHTSARQQQQYYRADGSSFGGSYRPLMSFDNKWHAINVPKPPQSQVSPSPRPNHPRQVANNSTGAFSSQKDARRRQKPLQTDFDDAGDITYGRHVANALNSVLDPNRRPKVTRKRKKRRKQVKVAAGDANGQRSAPSTQERPNINANSTRFEDEVAADESRLLLAHSLAMGSRVLNEPFVLEN